MARLLGKIRWNRRQNVVDGANIGAARRQVKPVPSVIGRG